MVPNIDFRETLSFLIGFISNQQIQNIFSLVVDPEIIEHGIPNILYFNNFAGYKVLVMTKTGPSLYNLQKKTRFGKFGIKTISKIAIQGVMYMFRFLFFSNTN